MRAGMRLALFRDLLVLSRRLLSVRGRRARIVWCLRRQTEPGFKFRDPRGQYLHLSRQRGNGFRLRQDQAYQRIFVERFKRFAIHPKLESVSNPLVKNQKLDQPSNNPKVGVSNYQEGKIVYYTAIDLKVAQGLAKAFEQ